MEWLLELALVALLAFKIASMVVRRFAGRYPIASAFLERTRYPARWLLVVAALEFVWEHAGDQLAFIGAVRHATALGCLADSTLYPIDINAARFFGRVAVDAQFTGMALSSDEAQRQARLLVEGKSVLLMANHGVMVVGSMVGSIS